MERLLWRTKSCPSFTTRRKNRQYLPNYIVDKIARGTLITEQELVLIAEAVRDFNDECLARDGENVENRQCRK